MGGTGKKEYCFNDDPFGNDSFDPCDPFVKHGSFWKHGSFGWCAEYGSFVKHGSFYVCRLLEY
jgi:hypothetical protein